MAQHLTTSPTDLHHLTIEEAARLRSEADGLRQEIDRLLRLLAFNCEQSELRREQYRDCVEGEVEVLYRRLCLVESHLRRNT